MKTVRFSQVVEHSGQPETYLLFSREDATFRKALAAGRVMTVVNAVGGIKTRHGVIGYDEKQPGQLLVFPKSLKKFEDARIVGIKEDLVADEREPKAVVAAKSKKEKASVPKAAREKKLARIWNKKAAAPPPEKLISFPAHPDHEAGDEESERLKGYAARALRALENGNTTAAINLLKKIVE